MSDVKSLNDLFDSKAFYRIVELKKYDRLAGHDGKLIYDFILFVKIASLTANGVNNMPMWRIIHTIIRNFVCHTI